MIVISQTKVSETYIKNTAIQYYTITNSGIDLKDILIVHINNLYTKNGELDIHQLFTIESVYCHGYFTPWGVTPNYCHLTLQ